MEDLLIEILSTFGYPVYLQGSLLPEEQYPDNFFTFWNDGSYDRSSYNDTVYSIVYEYSVNFYSNNSATVYSVLRKAVKLLKENGFIISGDGHSVASDEPTHDGRGVTVYFLLSNADYEIFQKKFNFPFEISSEGEEISTNGG